MNGLQQLRLWLRRGSTRSKALAAVATVVVVGLVIWLLIPASNNSSGAATTPNADASAGTLPVATTNDIATLRPTTCTPGTDQGVTATTIRVAVGLVDIPGINAAYNIPSPSQQEAWYGLVIGAINREGGVACRQVLPTYYHVNEIDPSSLQQNCLNIVASKPFAYIDDGAYLTASQKDCFPVGKVPFIGPTGVTDQQLSQYYPYFLIEGGAGSQVMRNAFQAFKEQGLFTATQGFKKEGLIYSTCTSSTGTLALEQLHLAGVKASQIVTYDIGCPTGTDSSSDLLEAITKFQHAGATDVSALDMVGDFPLFTRLAQQQGFHPKYAMPDYGYIATSSPTAQKPDPQNINGAELVSPGSYGFIPSPTTATNWCNSIYTSAGQPAIYDQGAGLGGVICNNLLLFKAAADYAPALQRVDLAAGIQTVGVVDYSWPQGPADYRGYHVTYGGQYWHSVEFSDTCSCWKPLQPQWQRPFQ